MIVDLAIIYLNMETASADWQTGQHLQVAGYEENKPY